MAERGAPIGNKNASKNKVWHAAIMRAVAKRSLVNQRDELDALAEKLLDLVSTGDLGALKEFGDRLDGKPAQAIVGDDSFDPISLRDITIRAIDATDRPTEEGK